MIIEVNDEEEALIFAHRKEKYRKKKMDELTEQYQRFLRDCIISGILGIDELPLEIILSNDKIYIAVFRVALSNREMCLALLRRIEKHYADINESEDNHDFIDYYSKIVDTACEQYGILRTQLLIRRKV